MKTEKKGHKKRIRGARKAAKTRWSALTRPQGDQMVLEIVTHEQDVSLEVG